MVDCSKTEIINGSDVGEPTQTTVAPAPDSVESIGHSSHMPFREFWPIYCKAVSKNPLRSQELSDYVAAQSPETIGRYNNALWFYIPKIRRLLLAWIVVYSGICTVLALVGHPFHLNTVLVILDYVGKIYITDVIARHWMATCLPRAYLAVNQIHDSDQLTVCALALSSGLPSDLDMFRKPLVAALQSLTDEQIERISVDAKRALAKLVEHQWFQKNVSVAILHRWRPLASAELLEVVRRVAAKQNTWHPIVAAATRCLPDLETLVGKLEQEQQLLRGAGAHASLDHLRATESPGGTKDQQELLRVNSHHRA